MHILVALLLAAALLYFWLAGWWFARVLVFIGLALIVGLISAERSNADNYALIWLCGLPLALIVAVLPWFYHRHLAPDPADFRAPTQR